MAADNGPDIDRPSTWIKFGKGLCTGCKSLCCCLPVEADAADLVRLGLISQDEATGSPKKIARRLMAAGLVRHFRARSGLFTLSQQADGACVFLSRERLCTVYDRRPGVCRRFPEIGPRPGFCPSRPKAY
jgi:Fe-S-cluster containining protein